MAPGDYLRIKQNNTVPSRADLDIIDDLSKNFGFSNGVINALVDYVLFKADNVLSRKYIEKIASSLARENVTTVIDTMNYLNKINTGWKTSKSPLVKTTGGDNKIQAEEISDDELEKILASIEAKKD